MVRNGDLSRDNPPWRDGYVSGSGSVRLHYVATGPSEFDRATPLIILLHGFPECWLTWWHQLSPLGYIGRTIALDLRGYNLSDKPTGISAYQIESLSEDVRSAIGSFGTEPGPRRPPE